MANNKYRSDRERDPIAELAQLIAEADPYGERAAPDNRFRRETASEGHDEAPGVPPAPQLPTDARAPEQTHELDEYRHDDESYDADNPLYASHEDYQTEAPRVRRRGLALVMAMTGLALLGTAGAFGYREIFGGSVIATPPPIITASSEPNKIAPVSGEPQGKNAATPAKTVQIPPARSRNSSRAKSNQRRSSRRKGHRPAWARRPRLLRLLPVSRYRTK